MLKYIDNFLNSITMYKLVVYGLLGISFISILFGFVGLLSFSGLNMLVSLFVFCAISYSANALFSKIFNAPTNSESWLITALILFLIVQPGAHFGDYKILALVALLAMASKYILAIRRKHIFNPAAVAVFIIGLMGYGVATWWVGSAVLLPFTAIVGLLIVRKIRRFSLLGSFAVCGAVSILVVGMNTGLSASEILLQIFTSWPFVFFATIMLTEPSTTPPTRKLQVAYGALVGILFGLQFEFHIGAAYVFSTPELVLLVGNIFAYIVSPKRKMFLKLRDKKMIADGVWEFVFPKDKHFTFKAGQYLEWTLSHSADARGNRRYFTVASSPTEETVRLATRVVPAGARSSSFKTALLALKAEDTIVGGGLAGDFTLPRDSAKKMVWIAGGIGVTPFRSMAQYIMDTKETRDVVLFYSAASAASFAYTELFKESEHAFGLKTVYLEGKNFITADMIRELVPDYVTRWFYLSGPNAMVESYKKLIRSLDVPKRQIITDYFPGF